MVYLEINKKNSDKLIDTLNTYLSKKGSKIFILIYMEGCGPCNETRPEWSKLKNVLSNHFLKKKDIVVVSIDKDLFGKLKHSNKEPMSFPTIRFMTNAGENVETYEDSGISTKDRKIDSFVEWIKLKTGENNITRSDNVYNRRIHNKINTRKRTRKYIGGKWSVKYRRSINCHRPKGFSQKQYCKHGRKKQNQNYSCYNV
jgi:thiol-disulfide isomerase/thioredoxin